MGGMERAAIAVLAVGQALTLALLLCGGRPAPLAQSAGWSSDPLERAGRRLQAVDAAANRVSVEPTPGPSPAPLPRPAPELEIDYDSPPRTGGGARPALVSAGPTEVPLNQFDFTPQYAPGTGQLTDPLSCMWLNPETGTLFFKCKVSFEPVPYAASAPPPPKFSVSKAAVDVRANAGSQGLRVMGEAGNTQRLFAVFNDPDAKLPVVRVQGGKISQGQTTIDHAFSPDIQGATLVVIGNETVSGAAALDVFTAAADANPVVRAQAQQVSLGKTSIFHAFSPSVQGSALQVTGLDGQPTLTAVSDDAASFFVKDGVTHAGSVNVDASIAPADTLLPALTVSGKLGLPPLIVSQAQGSGPVFGIAADGSTTSGPLTVSAALAPELTAPTLRVTGRTDVNAVEVKGTADSANPALTVSDDDTLFLGPTAIYGGIQPSAKAVLELGSPAPEQHLLDITTVPGAQAPDVVVAQDGLVKLPTLNVNSAVAVQSITTAGLGVSGPAIFNSGVAVGSDLSVGGKIVVDGRGATGPALQVTGSASVSQALSARNLTTSGAAKFGGDVTVGTSARGQQRSLTVSGRLNVKQDALFESSVEVWRSVTARWYFWWRHHRKHIPFTAPAELKPTGGSRKLA